MITRSLVRNTKMKQRLIRVRCIYSIRVVGRGRNKLNFKRVMHKPTIILVLVFQSTAIMLLLGRILKIQMEVIRVRRIYLKGVSKKTPILLQIQHLIRIIVRGTGGVRIAGGRSMQILNTIIAKLITVHGERLVRTNLNSGIVITEAV